MSKSETKTARSSRKITRTISLKTVHDDIMRDNKNATITTKKMRVWLRANMRDVHSRNDAWIFSPAEYNRVRAHFDPKFAASLTPRPTRRSRKIDTVVDVADA